MITYKDKKYKIVVVTPAGRKRYMEILLHYLIKQKNIVDEYRIWVNTGNPEDLNWFEKIKDENKDFITLEYLPKSLWPGGTMHICNFFKNTIDEDTIYIRFDDDVVWMEDDFIEKLVKFRIDNPDYFIVYGNIINNAVIDHIHQKQGIIYSKNIENTCLCKHGWENPNICEEKHNTFIQNLNNNEIQKYMFDRYETNGQRISINNICWFGKDFKQFSGIVGEAEEQWLSDEAPKQKNKKTCVYGGALCVHYAFWTQRDYLDKTDILDKYRKLAQKVNV
jgi:hypothetical protein